MAGKSYSIRGNLRPQLGSMQSVAGNLSKTQPPPPPRYPNRIPASIAVKQGRNR